MSDSGRRPPRLTATRSAPRKGRAGKGSGKNGARSRKPAARKTVKKAPSRRATPRRRGPAGAVLAFVWRLVWGFTWRVSLIVALMIGGGVAYYYSTLPGMQELLDGRPRGSVTMLDREGTVFAWRGAQFGGAVTAGSVSPHLKHAVIATEDKRFYMHPGVDPIGIAGAIRINLSEGRGPLEGHGGSTITQQTAKLLCLGNEYDPEVYESESAYEASCRQTTLWRKIREALYAMAMEAKYSKDEILSIYLNRAYMGGGAYGAEAAAQRFFGKPAAAVDPAEAAMLAGLLTAPTALAPTNNLQRSRDRAAVVVRLMEDQGYLTQAQAAQALSEPAGLSEAAEARAGGYFADWLMSSTPEYLTRDTTEDVVIRTTLDQRIQEAAEEALVHVFETKVREGSEAQAAIVVMSADGAVRAMVGGRKLRVSGVFNRATQANRQTGSAFKPFVYATALELGWHHDDVVVDEPITIDIPGSGPWSPENYSDNFYGPVTLTEALARSLNIPAVKISEQVGRENVRSVASDFGLESDLADGPALALGASESTLLEMTGAYAGILNGGSAVTPYGIVDLRLKGDDEPLIDNTGGGIRERVIREEAARELIYMMEKVVSQGTGQRARLEGREAAGKTGTTQAARDAWFVGFTSDYVAGVWMGYDDNTPLTGVTGGGLPAEIWRETMLRVHEGLEPRPLPMLRPPPRPETSRQTPRDTRPGDVGETVLEQVLQELFGGGGRR
ncbi:glycosyl transferase [Rhodosalinus halophilus]|uniref:peptidoglycan glycosyltransferase n=1 Tax=Rhodosalinus halophilus TaxID=2259333 RepID=A0A365UA09_9RHOB|nr:PBP1A family penicillin-binding protein [Rhodosalinus halophilus]RBI85571.1 glycosyl transferase [Rhodosalinus halophilus]